MKKLLKFLPFLLVAVMAVGFWSCDNDDDVDDIIVTEQQLPSQAKTFISDYYPSVKVSKVTKENNEYDVILSNRHQIEFSLTGEWMDVDAPAGETVPSGFYPAAINTYIEENLNGVGINEMSRENYGYDVELVDGRDLRFSTTGSFLGYDN
ncbi:MAG: PepSY-like domain-containing protein [Muribaculaceae bacterium]|nr:PepSY-like domain-containing protein [Muribaculaceae bacterium]